MTPITNWTTFRPHCDINRKLLNLIAKLGISSANVGEGGYWRRVGDSMEIIVPFPRGNIGIALPLGYQVDMSKLSHHGLVILSSAHTVVPILGWSSNKS